MINTSPFLAIDPGASTGVAWCDASGAVHHETWRLGDNVAHRLLKLVDHLEVLHSCEQFARIGYEEPWQGPHVNAVRALHHYEAVILVWSCRAGIPAQAYTPREIKAGIAGGAASKQRVIQHVRWLGHDPANEHEADAISLLLLMKAGVMPQEKVRKDATRARKVMVQDMFAKRKRTWA